ncbi:ABC transporter ATP-binding protein [Cellulomonas fimi]|uniref:ABC transporter ATP-binding protein n=1 Tax=Cellulomonas fimi TaxID=1708 RepID=A0A7Y0QGU4_CELFI|nr:ABC transporter ATP-binding protein [Cellulomonas fimi]NMR20476.1 ABC transporter ATP-binding protein [Cellulomonas fimi]
MDPVIEIRDLRKTYGPKVAVDGVSLAVGRGEIVGVLGPNGAGKTTLVECLAGVRRADSGSVRVLGVDPQRDPAAVRARLGMQLQEATLPARLRVREALELYAAFYPRPADPAELMRLLGLTEKAGTAFGDLSGGQQQRLSIALALVGDPEIAVLDELTTGLDPQARRDTWGLIERVRDRGVTIVLVTHFMDEAERLCDRVVIVDRGRIVASGTPRGLVQGDGDRRALRMRLPSGTPAEVAAEVAALPEVHALTRVDSTGEIEVTGDGHVLPATILALSRHGVVPDDVRTLGRTLEDVFVAVTGADPSGAAPSQPPPSPHPGGPHPPSSHPTDHVEVRS